MKKLFFVLLLTGCLLAVSACGRAQQNSALVKDTVSAPTTQMANPWVGYETLEQAADASSLSLPESIGTYQAEVFRVMSGQLLEVTYRDGDSEVTARVCSGEGQDISGDYNTYETVTKADRSNGSVTIKTDGTAYLTLISCGGCSYSLSAPTGYTGEQAEAFIAAILGE